MPGLKDFLLEQGPRIALGLMAARTGGSQGAAAFLRGIQDAQMRRQQLGIQQQERDRQAQLDQQAMEDRAFRRSDMEADNARADLQFKQQQFEHALALMERAAQMQGETASDPAHAEAALQQQATGIGEQYDVPAARLMQAAPPVAPLISGRKRKQAQAIYERAEKRYNPKGEHPEWETSITLQTGELFGDIKPADLRALFEAPAVDAMGTPALPPSTAPAPPPGSFEEYLAAPPERRAAIEAARKGYMQADDRPLAQPISIVVGPQGPMRVNRATGEALPVTDPSGQQVPPPLTEEQRNLAARRDKLIPAIEQMEALGATLITKVGPQQRAQAIRRGWDAVLGHDPEYRTYQDARVALAGNLAVAQQGSRPSDADIRAVWLPLVPDVFRDTKESAAMKWNMIRTNMSLPTSGGGPNQAIEDALKAQGIRGRVVGVREKQ